MRRLRRCLPRTKRWREHNSLFKHELPMLEDSNDNDETPKTDLWAIPASRLQQQERAADPSLVVQVEDEVVAIDPDTTTVYLAPLELSTESSSEGSESLGEKFLLDDDDDIENMAGAQQPLEEKLEQSEQPNPSFDRTTLSKNEPHVVFLKNNWTNVFHAPEVISSLATCSTHINQLPVFLVAAGTKDGLVRVAMLWQDGVKTLLNSRQWIPQHSFGGILSMSFCPSTPQLIVLNKDFKVLLLEIGWNNSITVVDELVRNEASCLSCADLGLVAIGSNKGTVELLQTKGTKLQLGKRLMYRPSSSVLAIQWHPSEWKLAVSFSDGTFFIVRHDGCVLLELAFPNPISAFAWEGDTWMAAGDTQGNVTVFDVTTKCILGSIQGACGVFIQSLAWHPVGGEFLAITRSDGSMCIVETDDFATVEEGEESRKACFVDWTEHTTATAGQQAVLLTVADVSGNVELIHPCPDDDDDDLASGDSAFTTSNDEDEGPEKMAFMSDFEDVRQFVELREEYKSDRKRSCAPTDKLLFCVDMMQTHLNWVDFQDAADRGRLLEQMEGLVTVLRIVHACCALMTAALKGTRSRDSTFFCQLPSHHVFKWNKTVCEIDPLAPVVDVSQLTRYELDQKCNSHW